VLLRSPKFLRKRYVRLCLLALLLTGISRAFGENAAAAEPMELRSTSELRINMLPAIAPLPVVKEPQGVEPHGFWDKTNLLLFGGIALTRGMDYASTRNFQARGRREILLPQDVVNNPAGFAGLEAASTMASVGISYLFHRSGHHRLERWL